MHCVPWKNPIQRGKLKFSPSFEKRKNTNINGLVDLTQLSQFKIYHIEADLICLNRTSEMTGQDTPVLHLKYMFRSKNQYFQFLCLPGNKQKAKLVIESVIESQKHLRWKEPLSSSSPTTNLFPLFFNVLLLMFLLNVGNRSLGYETQIIYHRKLWCFIGNNSIS